VNVHVVVSSRNNEQIAFIRNKPGRSRILLTMRTYKAMPNELSRIFEPILAVRAVSNVHRSRLVSISLIVGWMEFGQIHA
jgi:hypothetical protein